MKNFWDAFRMCLGMFCAIPLPKGPWDENLRRASTACLPLVGLVIGALWLLVSWLARLIFPQLLAAAVIAFTPFLLTGFIHLDGFMDTSDAILSWREQEERLKILKDVHVGSFAVVMIGMLFVFQFAACASLEKLFPLLLIPALSRTGSAMSVFNLKALGHSQYAAGTSGVPKSMNWILLSFAAVCALLMLIVSGWAGLLCAVVEAAVYALVIRKTGKILGGISGDLAGFALTVSELAALIVLAVF